MTARDLLRRVGADCAVEVDGNAYSVPWRLIGERVRVTVGAGAVRVLHGGREVAVHSELKGRRGRATDDRRLQRAVLPATTLVAQLAKAQADGRLEERLTHYAKPKLLIIDELGYLPFEPDAAHLFFQLVSRRYAAPCWSPRTGPWANGARCSSTRWSRPQSSIASCTTATC